MLRTLILCGNPCLQQVYQYTSDPNLEPQDSTEVIRCQQSLNGTGGKGANISSYFNHKQVQHTLVSFLGDGVNSQAFLNLIQSQSLTQFIGIPIQDDIRSCTTTIHDDQVQEWIGPSPQITQAEAKSACMTIANLLESGDYSRVVLAGTWPGPQFEDIQQQLLLAQDQGLELVVDSFQNSSFWLQENQAPHLWKLNQDEWQSLDSEPKLNNRKVLSHFRVSTSSQAVQLSGPGLLRITEKQKPIKAINTIGAGDIWLAEFLIQCESFKFTEASEELFRQALQSANKIALQRVQRLSYWDF